MRDRHEQTYYELLEVEPSASQEEILKAYNRARTTYGSNSPALYSLFSQDEAKELLKLIDEAYLVLSNQFKRKQYDLSQNKKPEAVSTSTPIHDENVIKAIPDANPIPFVETQVNVVREFKPPSVDELANTRTTKFGTYKHDEQFEKEFFAAEHFTGTSLEKLRLYKNISLEQMATTTKVGRPYLLSLERDEFNALPATVYVRGFLVQYLKALNITSDRVVQAYINNMKKARKE